MSGELKPCPTPWCGSGPAIPMTRGLAGFSGVEIFAAVEKPYVWCGTCGVCGPACDTEAAAITAWNTRTDTNSDLLAALEGAVTSLLWWQKNEPGSFGNVDGIRLESARTAISKHRALIEGIG